MTYEIIHQKIAQNREDWSDVYYIYYYLLLYTLFIYYVLFVPQEVDFLHITIDRLVVNANYNRFPRNFIKNQVIKTSQNKLTHFQLILLFSLLITLTPFSDLLKLISSVLSLTISLYSFLEFIRSIYYEKHQLYKIIRYYDSSKSTNVSDTKNSKLSIEQSPVYKSINEEIMDGFSNVIVSSKFNSNTYITNNWIIKITTYNIYAIPRNAAKIIIDFATVTSKYPLVSTNPLVNRHVATNRTVEQSNSDSDSFSDSPSPAILTTFMQDLSLKIHYVHNQELHPNFPAKMDYFFNFVINSDDYNEMIASSFTNIENPKNLCILKSIEHQFLDAFKAAIMRNQYLSRDHYSENILDKCISCYDRKPEIKIESACSNDNCGNCTCYPMWCLYCIGRWFYSKQSKHDPIIMSASTQLCPSCRVNFCLKDVHLLT